MCVVIQCIAVSIAQFAISDENDEREEVAEAGEAALWDTECQAAAQPLGKRLEPCKPQQQDYVPLQNHVHSVDQLPA